MEQVTKKCPAGGVHNGECERSIMAVRDALDILSGKWKLPIILALTFKKYRFKELVRAVGTSPKMLSKELKELEINQLIERTVWDTAPVTVEYSITPYGRTLKEVIMALGQWGTKHRQRIMSRKKAVA